jgi:hypothetical protein
MVTAGPDSGATTIIGASVGAAACCCLLLLLLLLVLFLRRRKKAKETDDSDNFTKPDERQNIYGAAAMVDIDKQRQSDQREITYGTLSDVHGSKVVYEGMPEMKSVYESMPESVV